MKNFNGPLTAVKAIAAWNAALRLQQFGYSNISREISVSVAFATEIVRGWESLGTVRVIVPKSGSGRKIYEVVAPHEVVPVVVTGDGVDQMWTAMRKLTAFSAVDLAAHCAAPVSLEEARAYCRLLLTGGYLRVVQKAVPNRREAIYRLSNVTGVGAPRERRVRCIVDPNLGKTTPLAEAGQ